MGKKDESVGMNLYLIGPLPLMKPENLNSVSNSFVRNSSISLTSFCSVIFSLRLFVGSFEISSSSSFGFFVTDIAMARTTAN